MAAASIVLLFLGMGILVLIHVCIVGRTLVRRIGNENNNNSSSAAERGRLGSTTSMSRDDVEKLPCFEFSAKEMNDCAVCLENFKAGERCRLLPICRHSFHAECIDTWLLRTPICPVCRAAADDVGGSSLITAAAGDQSFGYVHSSMASFGLPASQYAEESGGRLTGTGDALASLARESQTPAGGGGGGGNQTRLASNRGKTTPSSGRAPASPEIPSRRE